MAEKEKISVIVPCFNVQNYIMRCFTCIQSQTYGFENLEVIFIDDVSDDETWKILQELQKKYPQNVVISQLKKKGHSGGARNVGIDLCTGQYLTFVEADDWIHPEMLSLLHAQMQKEDYDIVQGDAFMFSNPHALDYELKVNSVDTYDLHNPEKRKEILLGLTQDLNLTVWSKIYSTKFIKNNQLHFLENCYFEDNHFTLMCSVLARKYCKVYAPIYGYYDNVSGTIIERLNPIKIRQLEIVVTQALQDIQTRNIDVSTYQDALDNFVFYKLYIETTTNLEIAFYSEKEHYREGILEKIPNIKKNPYLKNYTSVAAIQKIKELGDDVKRDPIG